MTARRPWPHNDRWQRRTALREATVARGIASRRVPRSTPASSVTTSPLTPVTTAARSSSRASRSPARTGTLAPGDSRTRSVAFSGAVGGSTSSISKLNGRAGPGSEMVTGPDRFSGRSLERARILRQRARRTRADDRGPRVGAGRRHFDRRAGQRHAAEPGHDRAERHDAISRQRPPASAMPTVSARAGASSRFVIQPAARIDVAARLG